MIWKTWRGPRDTDRQTDRQRDHQTERQRDRRKYHLKTMGKQKISFYDAYISSLRAKTAKSAPSVMLTVMKTVSIYIYFLKANIFF